MKAMKPADVRKMSPEEIRAKISDKRDELMKLRFQQVSGQLTDPASLNVLGKDIARLETILAEMLRSAAVEGEK